MGGTPTQTTNTTQQATSQPWAPAVPALQSLIAGIGSQSTAPTALQTAGMTSLQQGAAGIPNFGPQAGNVATGLFGGGAANAQSPFAMDAYNKINASLSPLTNPSNLNPMNTPGLSDALSSLRNSITGQVNDQFAASGRDLSPGNTQALAQGLSYGLAPSIVNAYQNNVGNLLGASNSLYGAGAGTANQLTGFNQLGNQNRLAGLGAAGAIPGLALAPGQAQLGAANAGYNLPFANLGTAESLLTPLAALGGQTQGSGTQTSQYNIPPWQQALGYGIGGVGALGSFFGAPAGGTSGAQGLFGGLGSLFA